MSLLGRMTSRILYADDQRLMYLCWLGLGPLEARDRQRIVRASAAQKAYFLAAVRHLESQGVKIHPDDPTCTAFMRAFAEQLHTRPPSDIAWKFMRDTGGLWLADSVLRERQS